MLENIFLAIILQWFFRFAQNYEWRRKIRPQWHQKFRIFKIRDGRRTCIETLWTHMLRSIDRGEVYRLEPSGRYTWRSVGLPLSSIFGVEYSFKYLNENLSTRWNRKFCGIATRSLSSFCICSRAKIQPKATKTLKVFIIIILTVDNIQLLCYSLLYTHPATASAGARSAVKIRYKC